MIRKATSADIPRIAETSVFAKRMAYRILIDNESVLFNNLDVLKVSKALEASNDLSRLYVFDDGILKGTVKLDLTDENAEIDELYVDPFFAQNGIGRELLSFCEAKAKESGAKSVKTYCFEEDTSTAEFFINCGYLKSGKTKHDSELNITLLEFFKNL